MILATIEYDGVLSPVAWIVLFGILSFIFGALGWALYRAAKAVNKEKNSPRP